VSLHEDAIVIDGLNVSEWTPEVFESMRRAGVTAANCTCCIWEGFEESMRELARWKRRFDEHADTLMPVRDVDDITRAKQQGKVGVILGWQNSSGFEDHLPFVGLFAELGLRVVQLTYNTANAVGCGCYESRDGGLTDFGHDLVAELNRVGILIDLSHVGARTARDAIRASGRPVAYTHTLPSACREHPRNKTDDELRLIAEHGGFVGLTFFPAFLRRGPDSTIDDYLDAAEHVMSVAGEERVGIGTDFTEGRSPAFFDYISRDKGYGRRLVDLGPVVLPEGLRRIEDLPNLACAMQRRGWSEPRIRRFLGENWLRFLRDAWQPARGASAMTTPNPAAPRS
jgi:membrane dipeptidase